MIFPTADQSAEVVQPREEALDFPAAAVTTQFAADQARTAVMVMMLSANSGAKFLTRFIGSLSFPGKCLYASFLLNRSEIFGEVVDAQLNDGVVALNVAKNVSPHWHVARTVGWDDRVALTHNDVGHTEGGKLAAVLFGEQCEIGRLPFERRCRWPIAFSVEAMANRAVRVIHLYT
jgi:hypothetical protein